MTDSTSAKTFKLSNGLRIFLSSLYIALFVLSAGDLNKSFEEIQNVLSDTSFLNQSGPGQLSLLSLIVGTLAAFLLPVGSLYMLISGLRGKNNPRWILISTVFTGSLILLTSLVIGLFVVQGYRNDTFVLGWKSFVHLYMSNSFAFGKPSVDSRELLITITVILIAVVSLVVLLTNKKTFLNPIAKKISLLLAPTSKKFAELWSPISKQLSSKPSNTQSGSFARTLVDVSFDRFIYIKVASLLYFVSLVLIGLFNAMLVLAVMVGLTLGDLAPESILLIPASFISSVLIVILMRLAFESGIALIKIAENTGKK
jgi:hypothetical protein